MPPLRGSHLFFWGRFPGFRPLRGSTAGLLYGAPPGLRIRLAGARKLSNKHPFNFRFIGLLKKRAGEGGSLARLMKNGGGQGDELFAALFLTLFRRAARTIARAGALTYFRWGGEGDIIIPQFGQLFS